MVELRRVALTGNTALVTSGGPDGASDTARTVVRVARAKSKR